MAWVCRAALVLVLALVSGCAHLGPKDWPQEIGGRRIRDGGSVWIYASDGDSADEVATMVRTLGDATTGERPNNEARGVVIVTEAGEQLPDISSINTGAAGMVRDFAAQIPDPRLRAKIEQNADSIVGLVAIRSSGRTLKGATGLPTALRREAPYVVSVPSENAILNVFRGARDAVVEEARLPLLQRQVLSRALEMGRDEFVLRVREIHEQVIRAALSSSTTPEP